MRLNLPVRLTEHIPPCLHTNTRVVGRLHTAGGRATLPGADVETPTLSTTTPPPPFFPPGVKREGGRKKKPAKLLRRHRVWDTCQAGARHQTCAPPPSFYNTTTDSMRDLFQPHTSRQLSKHHTLGHTYSHSHRHTHKHGTRISKRALSGQNVPQISPAAPSAR